VFDERRLGVWAESEPGLARSGYEEQGPNKRRKTETGLVKLVGGYGEESEPEVEKPAPSADGIVGIGVLGDYGSDEEREADSVEGELRQVLDS
jgi:hypothetical protein